MFQRNEAFESIFGMFFLNHLVTKEGNIKHCTEFMNALKIPEMTSWP